MEFSSNVMRTFSVFIFLGCLVIQCNAGAANPLEEDIYVDETIVEGAACYRIMNGTHQFGCHGSKETMGVVMSIESVEEAKLISTCWRDKFNSYNGKFFLLMSLDLLNRESVAAIRASNCVSGLLLFRPENASFLTSGGPLSHDANCPNQYSSSYGEEGACEAKSAWNELGAILPQGLRNIDWNLQIVFLEKTAVQKIQKCYSLFNGKGSSSDYPFCAVSFGVFNSAAGSTQICYRRGLESSKFIDWNLDTGITPEICSPLMGFNIFGFPVPCMKNDSTGHPNSKYLMLATRMDSFGVIPDVSPGDMAVMTSLISLLASARAMATNAELFQSASKQNNKYVMFSVFNGEAFDYIGSSATAYKMEQNTFPHANSTVPQLDLIRPSQVDLVIEAQLIGSSEGKELFVHVDGERFEKSGQITKSALQALSTGAKSVGAHIDTQNLGKKIPSASWHSFAKSDTNVQSIVITPFQETIKYNRYNSMADYGSYDPDTRTKIIDSMMAVSSATLRAGAEYVGIEPTKADILSIDRQFVSTLFDCLVASDDFYSCKFLEKLNGGRFNQSKHSYALEYKSTYIGVAQNPLTRMFVHWLMIYALGSKKETFNIKDKKQCDDMKLDQEIYAYDWQPDPLTGHFHCYKSATLMMGMRSPAFDIPDYDFKNSTYSTWTESVYELDKLRIFVIEQQNLQYWMFGLGLLVSLLSLLIVAPCGESTFIIDEGETEAEQGEPL
ncbi:hypothetical protein WR25_21953 [Diploscapter pachys]|uniref:Nicastrin n=1 Tax=Diploscapter pachys TaxID=2018661 RepID=A0A2A2K592_9BILA|nr:hypothetical protein WR25_21953 [Diploscapter pachys]